MYALLVLYASVQTQRTSTIEVSLELNQRERNFNEQSQSIQVHLMVSFLYRFISIKLEYFIFEINAYYSFLQNDRTSCQGIKEEDQASC